MSLLAYSCRSLTFALLIFIDAQALFGNEIETAFCVSQEDVACENKDFGALHLLQKAAVVVQKHVATRSTRQDMTSSMHSATNRSIASFARTGIGSHGLLESRSFMNPYLLKFPFVFTGGVPKIKVQIVVDPPASMSFVNYIISGIIAVNILGLILLLFKVAVSTREDDDNNKSRDNDDRDILKVAKYVGLLLAAVDANDWMVFAFFPEWCIQRGLSETKAGTIVSMLGVGLVLCAPFTQFYIGSAVGPNKTLWFGSRCYVFTRLMCIALLFIPTPALFQIACGVFLVTGMCWAVTEVSAAAWVLTSVNAEHRVTAMGYMLGARILGSIIGPALGGILFDIGGLWMPFSFGFFILITVQQYGKPFFTEEVEYEEMKAFAKGSILRHIPVLICAIVSTAVASGFACQAVWQEIVMLERYRMWLWEYGLLFTVLMVLIGAFMATVVPAADKMLGPVPAILFGLLTVGSGYLIIGPSALLPFLPATEVWIPLMGTLVWGIGTSFPLVILNSFVTNVAIGAGWPEMDAAIQWATIQIILSGVSLFLGPPFFIGLISHLGVGGMCTTVALVMTCFCGGLTCLLFCASYTDASQSGKTSQSESSKMSAKS